MTINFNTNPYYDDFDEDKKFHRILFRPGYAIQARELTQLQTQLQDQIKKFGNHVFVNGSVVLDGERNFQDDVISLKLESSYGGQIVNVNNFANTTIIGGTSGAEATVKGVFTITESDPITLVVKVISGDNFVAGEIVTTADGTFSATIQQLATDPINNAMLFSVDRGIFYVDGNFVYTDPQIIAVDKYSNTSSKNIGFIVEESIIDSDLDESLLDRAQGTPNFAAPGADRYKVNLKLSAKDLTTTTDNFVEIARVVDGVLVLNQTKTIYSELGKELARRTFDESGDYTVKKWPIQLLDLQNVPLWVANKELNLNSVIVHNGKYYEAISVTNTKQLDGVAPVHTSGIVTHGDVDLKYITSNQKFTVALDPGKGYIKGYEFETISQQFITADRARDFDQASNLNISLLYGNYVYVNSLEGPIQTNGTSSSDAYEAINLYNSSNTIIGTARIRHIQWHEGTPGTTNAVYKLYLFNISMIGSYVFGSVNRIGNGSSITATIDNASKTYNSQTQQYVSTVINGADSPGLVFDFPNEYIKTVKDATSSYSNSYQTTKEYNVSLNSGVVTLNISGNQTFAPSSDKTLSSDEIKTYYHVVMTSGTGGGYSTNDVIDFTTTSRSVVTSNNGQSITFNIGDSASSASLKIIATTFVSNYSPREKTLSQYQTKVITTTLNQTLGESDSLEVSDVYDILAVYNIGTDNGSTISVDAATGAITWNGVSHTDVTDNYTLDDGQRAEFYDHSSLVLTGTGPAVNTDNLFIVYRYFTHTGSGYFSVDSYDGSGLDYGEIPEFKDPSSGEIYNLRDVLDFRPVRDAGATTFSGGEIPDPDSYFNTDYQYYLARMDKVIATSDKQFVIQKGVPSIKPKVPSDLSNGMTLYVLIIPPYTANVSDISVKYMDNKRYTMRDIGKLDKRIQNLEYYTQLSLLEKQAKDTSIPDASNFEKFKNGFIVDAFTSADIFAGAAPDLWAQRRWGWWNAWFNGSNNWNEAAQNYNENSIANVASTEFNAAIDSINQELRAPFDTQFHYFNVGTLVSTERNSDNISLTYTEELAIDQSLATTYINVNPFNIIRFLGVINLEPSFDQWMDTQNLPAVNRIVDVQLPDAADRTVTIASNGRFGIFRTTSRTTTVQNNVISSSSQSLGANVVDIQFVPFMRANTTIGIANQFKPNSRLYGFMEGTSIDSYLKPLMVVTVTNHQGTLFDGRQGVYESLSFRSDPTDATSETATAKTAIYTGPTTANNTQRLLYIYDRSGTFNVGDYVVGTLNGGSAEITAISSIPTLGSPLIPDEFGNLGFEFEIPANTFRTGERTIRLINNSSNDADAQDSIGEAKYTAIGQVQTKQETILTTRSLQRQRTTVTRGFWYDPVAESFLVDPDAYPNGMHLTAVDVYFRTKSSTVPVTMEIRRTVNGYPESQTTTIPFGITTLQPYQVNTSTTSSIATKFNFPAIHLIPGEYAITLVANSSDYEVFVAEMGKDLLDGSGKVDKQPYAGSLFKSQNASTWEADQNKDLKFRIHRAKFTTSGSAEFEIQSPSSIKEYHALFANVNAITPTGTSIKWYGKAYDGNVYDGSWLQININQDLEYTRMLQLAPQVGNVVNPTLQLRAELSTDSDQISPVVDASSLSVVLTENLINNDSTDETNAAGGNAIAKYITKPVTLADGFDASNINVTLDIYKPPLTNIEVYYRALPSGVNTPLVNEGWVEMILDPTQTIIPSVDEYDYKEHKFYPPGAFDSNGYGIPQDDPISPRFNTFQIKIVMLSSAQQYTPKLKDLRIIALDS